MKQNESFYSDAIHSIIPAAYNICRPQLRGSQNNVLMADTDTEKYVFKFSSAALVKKNELVSTIFQAYDIPVPTVSAISYQDQFFEMYSYIPGKTLYEHIGQGLSGKNLELIYQELLRLVQKMSKIDTALFNTIEYKYCYQIAKINIINSSSNVLLANIFGGLVHALSAGKKGIYHSDITPKNVIISDDGRIAALLDIDSVALCNEHFALGAMLSKYQQLGYKLSGLYDFYEDITGRHIDRNRITAQANLNNIGKKILWHNSLKTKQGR